MKRSVSLFLALIVIALLIPFASISVSAATHAGTKADPYTAADANSVGSKLATNAFTSSAVYVKGIVSSFEDAGNYVKNLKLVDKKGDTATFLCYTVNKTTSVSSIKVGDTVVVYGYIKNYNGTAEIATKNDGGTSIYAEFISSDNAGTGGDPVVPPVSGDPTHKGTKADPYSAADANIVGGKLASGAFTSTAVYVKGIVSSFEDKDTYVKNLKLVDKKGDTASFLCYSVSMTDAVSEIKVGDTVVVYGFIKNYSGTAEMATKTEGTTTTYAEFISSDNGGTGGQDDPPISGDTTHAGTKADPYSVADAIIAASALGEKEYSKDRVYVKGIIDTCSDVGSYVQNIHLIDKDGDKVFFTVYSANETDTCKDPKVGDTVVIFGYLVNWYGTPEMSNLKLSETENIYPEFVSITKGDSPDPLGDTPDHSGTADDPYSATDAIIVASQLNKNAFSADRVYVTGVVKSFTDKETFVQNLYLINEEGDKNAFLVYSANKTDDVPSIAVGETVTVYGYLINYNGTPEMSNQKFSETENVYPELVETIDITDKTLEERLIEKVGEKNAKGKFDVIIEAPETFEKGKEIEVSVIVKNITVTEGLSQLDFVFNYDNKNLVITNALGDDKALNCVDKLPSENWDNLSRIKFDEKGIVNAGKVEVGVLNASDNVSAKKDGDIAFKFTFTVDADAEDEIGFYIANASVSGYDWTNTETIYVGNGSYAITKVAEEGKILIGDVNLDGVVNSRDYALLKRHCLNTYKLEGDGLKAGDINGDGAVNAKDYGLLKRACLGTYTIVQ